MGQLTEEVMAYMCIGDMVNSVIDNGAKAEYVWAQKKRLWWDTEMQLWCSHHFPHLLSIVHNAPLYQFQLELLIISTYTINNNGPVKIIPNYLSKAAVLSVYSNLYPMTASEYIKFTYLKCGRDASVCCKYVITTKYAVVPWKTRSAKTVNVWAHQYIYKRGTRRKPILSPTYHVWYKIVHKYV